MADNVTLDIGIGGAVAATDDIAGVHYQRVKITWGVDGTANDANASTPLPVTVTSSTALTPGSAAANLGKAEDAAHASGDVGVMMLAVRRDTAAVGSVADGDYSTINVNANGHVYTIDANSAAILAALAAIETAVEGTLTVGSHAVTNAGTFAVQAAQSGTWNVGTVTAVTAITNALPAGNNNIGNVDIVSSALPTGAATSANQTTGNAILTTIDADTSSLAGCVGGTELQVDIVGGGITGATHDSAVAAEGVQAMLDARSVDPTAVASADAVRAIASLLGKQVVLPYAIPASMWSYASPAAVTDTADDVAIAAGAGAIRRYITGIQVFNGHATVSTEVVIKDGATVLWRGWAQAVGGGAAARFDPPLRGTAATAVNVANITTGAATYFNLQGFSAAE